MLLAVVLNLASGLAFAGAWAVGYWDMRRRLRGAEGGPGGRTPPGTRDGYVLAA